MQKLEFFALVTIFGIAALGMTAPSAHAILIEKDLDVLGDKLITLDTVTGLEWLDVTATLNLSYNAAELTSFVTAKGFSHATLDDVSTLYTNAGVSDQTGSFVAANFAGVQDLLLKLGCTGNCGTTSPFQQGISDLSPVSPVLVALPFVRLNFPSTARAVVTGVAAVKASAVLPSLGNYLFRQSVSVPEPASWALMVFGLTALAWFRRRRRTL